MYNAQDSDNLIKEDYIVSRETNDYGERVYRAAMTSASWHVSSKTLDGVLLNLYRKIKDEQNKPFVRAYSKNFR